jgi:hypothetical protein
MDNQSGITDPTGTKLSRFQCLRCLFRFDTAQEIDGGCPGCDRDPGPVIGPIAIPDTNMGNVVTRLRKSMVALRHWRRLAMRAQTESGDFGQLAGMLLAVEDFLNLGYYLERVAVGERHVTGEEARQYPGSDIVRYYALIDPENQK